MMAIATNKLNKRIASTTDCDLLRAYFWGGWATGGVGDSACPGTAYGHLATDCVLLEASILQRAKGSTDKNCREAWPSLN